MKILRKLMEWLLATTDTRRIDDYDAGTVLGYVLPEATLDRGTEETKET